MRSVKAERMPRGNPRSPAGRKPVRATRKLVPKVPRREPQDGGVLGSWDRLKALATRPILALTGGTMPEIVVEATGLTPVVLQAVEFTATGGQVLLLGSPRAALEAFEPPPAAPGARAWYC